MAAEPLPHLLTFARAAECGSFTLAGRSLGITQAAVSQRIQALEAAVGVPLFEREAGHVVLTEAGHLLHGYAQRIAALQQQALQALSGQKTPRTGELTLAASSVPGEYLLPDLLAAFRQQQPHIQVRALVGDSQQVLRQIEQGKAQLGLVGGKSDNPHLEFRWFARDELAVIVPAGHPWGRRKRVSPADLGREPLIMREAGSGSRWCLERALAETGATLQDLHVTLELGSNEAIKEAVQRGLGLAVLSTHVVRQEVAAGTLHTLHIAGLPLVREMYVVWDRRRALAIPAQLFLDLLSRPENAKKP